MKVLHTTGRLLDAFLTACGVVLGLTPDPTRAVPVEVERQRSA